MSEKNIWSTSTTYPKGDPSKVHSHSCANNNDFTLKI